MGNKPDIEIKELFQTAPTYRPKTRQCEAVRSERYSSDTPDTDRQCTYQSRYVIDGVHLCARHAGRAALDKLLEQAKSQAPKKAK